MRFLDITKRLSGFSTPLGGVSWTPIEGEGEIARRVISFPEDRRVLYNPSSLEVSEHSVESVLVIREEITKALGGLQAQSGLAIMLKAIRAACREFLDKVDSEPHVLVYGIRQGHYASRVFLPALGELRSEIGIQVAFIATAFKLDVEDGLASTFPAKLEDDLDE